MRSSVYFAASCVLLSSSVAAQCVQEFEETVCRNFRFSHDLILDSATNRLTITNASGVIIHENFSKLTDVAEIRIADSDIAKIEPGAVCCTPNLTAVTIAANRRFPKVTRHTLQGCHALKKLTLDGAIAIARGAFAESRDLKSLTLNATNVDVNNGTVSGLPTLNYLSIRNSAIAEIADGAFSGLDELRNLDLQNNGIERVGTSAFRNLTQLRVLNLSDNRLQKLTWHEFDGLKNLRVLFLERNDIEAVDADKLVAGVPDLERIFLSYDRLRPYIRERLEEVLPKAGINLIYAGKPYENM